MRSNHSLLFLIFSFALVACDTGSKVSDKPKNNFQKINPFNACIPESQLMATNIVRGEIVKPTDPDANTAVMVIGVTSDGSIIRCTANPISPRALITAAHCLEADVIRYSAVFHSSITCESGYKPEEHLRTISRMIRHTGYDESVKIENRTDDIGLLILREDIPQGYPIYQLAATDTLTGQEPLLLYGYGKTSAQDPGDFNLRRATVNPANYSISLERKLVRIDQREASGICMGDSGGASFVEVNGQRMILGISSYVAGSEENACSSLGALTLASAYTGWIEQSLQKVEQTPSAR